MAKYEIGQKVFVLGGIECDQPYPVGEWGTVIDIEEVDDDTWDTWYAVKVYGILNGGLSYSTVVYTQAKWLMTPEEVSE